MEKAKQLISPAPMLGDPVDARLAGLLVPAPHVVPEKKAKKVAARTRKSVTPQKFNQVLVIKVLPRV